MSGESRGGLHFFTKRYLKTDSGVEFLFLFLSEGGLLTWEQLECDNRGESGSCESNYLPREMGGGEGGLFQVLLLTCWTGPIRTTNVDPGFFAANMRWEIFLEILNLWCGVVCSFVEGKNVFFGIDGHYESIWRMSRIVYFLF